MKKQETLEEFAEKVSRAFDNDNYKALMDLVKDGANWQQEYNKYLSCCRSKEECYCKEEPKQETIEEAAERFYGEEEVVK
jgi:hypothetical protein